MKSGRYPGRSQTRALFAGSVLAAALLWVLFVATFSPHELIVGVFSVAASVAFSVFVCRSSGMHATLRPRDLAQCWRGPGNIAADVLTVTVVLFKDLFHLEPAQDLYRVCGFDSSKSDPVRVARTAMAVVFTTASPNFLVIGVDVSQSRMIFHQLKTSGVPAMTRALGAKG